MTLVVISLRLTVIMTSEVMIDFQEPQDPGDTPNPKTIQMIATQDNPEGNLTQIPEAIPAQNRSPTQQEHAMLGAPMTPDIPEAREAREAPEAQVAQEAPVIPETHVVREVPEDLEVLVDEEAPEVITTHPIKTTPMVMDIPNNNTPCPNNLITRRRTPLL